MPTNMLALDSSFPQLSEKQSSSEKIKVVTDYLYMLLEQLRYTLANLGAENFNAAALKEIEKQFSEPIYGRIEDTEGNVAELELTINGMRLEVSNGEESSTISLTANGAAISSQEIKLSGMVTFKALAGEGTTTIDGSNIKTGCISGVEYRQIFKAPGSYGGGLGFYYASDRTKLGGLRLDDEGSGGDAPLRLIIYTQPSGTVRPAIKLQSAAGISLDANDGIYLKAGDEIMLHAADAVTISGSQINLSGSVYIGDMSLTAKINSLQGQIDSLSGKCSSLSARIAALEASGS